MGSDGLRVGAAYFDVRYELGSEYAALLARGTASSSTVFASYPFIRSRLANLNGSVSYEDKATTDFVDSSATVTGKKVKVTNLGLSGNLQDNLAGGGFTSVEASLIQGKLAIQSPGALAIDLVSAHTNGSYRKMTWGVSRLQRIGNDTLLSISLNGQRAGKNLDSSEKFSLGGPTGIRAYPAGEGNGDQGYRGTLELRHTLLPTVQGVLFYEFGAIHLNKNPFGAASDSRQTLSGAGFGINATISKVQLKASVAWRLSSDLPLSIPANTVKPATLWLQAYGWF